MLCNIYWMWLSMRLRMFQSFDFLKYFLVCLFKRLKDIYMSMDIQCAPYIRFHIWNIRAQQNIEINYVTQLAGTLTPTPARISIHFRRRFLFRAAAVSSTVHRRIHRRPLHYAESLQMQDSLFSADRSLNATAEMANT